LSPTCSSIPKGGQAARLQREIFSSASMVAIPAARLAALRARLLSDFDDPRRSDQSLLELGRALVAHLAPGSERDERPEARVRRMLAWAAARLDTPATLADAAAHVGLSSGRARHVFVEENGAAVSHLPALAASDARARTLLGRRVSHRGRARRRLLRSPHLSRTFRPHVRDSRRLAPRLVAPSFKGPPAGSRNCGATSKKELHMKTSKSVIVGSMIIGIAVSPAAARV